MIGGSIETIPFSRRIILGSVTRLCGLPFIAAFYSKEIIIEGLIIYNYSLIRFLLVYIGIFMTIWYRRRFLYYTVFRGTKQIVISFKEDNNNIINKRIRILILPAIRIGALISRKIIFHIKFYLIRIGIKLFTIIILFITIFLRINYFSLSIHKKSTFSIWFLGGIWGLPYTTTEFPLYIIRNIGDYYSKLSDYSWLIHFHSNFLINRISSIIFSNQGIRTIQFFARIKLIFLRIFLLIIIINGV